MRELAESDRRRIAIAGHAEINQVTVGEVGAGQHRWQAAVHRIETVRIAKKIIRGLRRAADAGDLGHAMRLDRKLIAGLDNRGRDRIVAATGAQGGNLAFVIPMGVTEIVLRQARMMEFRFGDVSHDASLRSGVNLSWSW